MQLLGPGESVLVGGESSAGELAVELTWTPSEMSSPSLCCLACGERGQILGYMDEESRDVSRLVDLLALGVRTNRRKRAGEQDGSSRPDDAVAAAALTAANNVRVGGSVQSPEDDRGGQGAQRIVRFCPSKFASASVRGFCVGFRGERLRQLRRVRVRLLSAAPPSTALRQNTAAADRAFFLPKSSCAAPEELPWSQLAEALLDQSFSTECCVLVALLRVDVPPSSPAAEGQGLAAARSGRSWEDHCRAAAWRFEAVGESLSSMNAAECMFAWMRFRLPGGALLKDRTSSTRWSGRGGDPGGESRSDKAAANAAASSVVAESPGADQGTTSDAAQDTSAEGSPDRPEVTPQADEHDDAVDDREVVEEPQPQPQTAQGSSPLRPPQESVQSSAHAATQESPSSAMLVDDDEDGRSEEENAFVCRLERHTPLERFGVDFAHPESGVSQPFLRVAAVCVEGPMAQWNGSQVRCGRVSRVVRPGMLVIGVNGRKGSARALMEELRVAKTVDLSFRLPGRVERQPRTINEAKGGVGGSS